MKIALKKAIKHPRVWWWIGGLAVLLVVLGVIVTIYGGDSQQKPEVTQVSKQQQVAIDFFEATWVQGDQEKGWSLLSEELKNNEQFQQVYPNWIEKGSKETIFIVESPTDAQTTNHNTYYLYRPSDQKTVKIRVDDQKVTATGQFLPDADEAYHQLNKEYPGLNKKWKEVHPEQ
ncbi:hypothetical protein GCM10011571_33450 [Marinithermofilum abyssi]|uniref:Uncharacterized protein n=1 Tax=Marinithermofilum abyssi TaxID=1571185 RepID=A0A8J2VJE1_9BACL|nr:hypothetical protein [Marinithermofilum abyssi]GGE28656.1 hypothetical protein GCM10011571_33450 [Marinithermofilum abyssi]